MAEPTIPPKAKLFVGILTSRVDLQEKAESILQKKYGPIDYQTTRIPFTNTDYYNAMGDSLFKMLYSFKKLVKREKIVPVKLATNRLEKKLSGSSRRLINIDPGYITLSNVYLASCKEFFHRTYLGKGIYLENEYKYTAKRFHPWEWTYPDYLKREYLDFFHTVRDIYYRQLKS